MYKKLKIISAVIVIAAFLVFVYDFADGQFRLNNVRDDISELQNTPLSNEEQHLLETILAQPFSYLDRGKQSYVFASQDGQYVLKFFDIRRYKPGWPTLFSASSQARMKRKMGRLFKGYQLAYEFDLDNAVIVFQQLVPNAALKYQAVINDRFGFKQVIDLGQVPFIIQRKGVPTRYAITELLKKGNVEEAKRLLRKIMDMYVVEYQRGLYDRDHNFMYNTGFVGETPIRLDLGRLRADDAFKDPRISRADLEKIAYGRTEGWLQRHFPRYQKEILEDLHKKIDEIYLQ